MKTTESNAARKLQRAKAYWLQTVQPYSKGRRLRDAELYITRDAHRRLREAVEQAKTWNGTKDGKRLPISPVVFAELETDTFREPEALCQDENLKPETLAQLLLKNKSPGLTPGDEICQTHEALIEAERYIRALPTEKQGTESLIEELNQASSTVSFTQILQSSDEKSGQVPLLRGIAKKRAALTLPALKIAVRRFFEREKKSRPKKTKKEWNRELQRSKRLVKQGTLLQLGTGVSQTYDEWQNELDNEINDCLQNNRISLQRLCDLRWQRFKTFWDNQSARRHAGATKPRKKRTSKN